MIRTDYKIRKIHARDAQRLASLESLASLAWNEKGCQNEN